MQSDEQTQQQIQATLAGDRQAFANLVKAHETMLVSFASYRIPQHEEALEAVQDTFVRAYEQLADFKQAADFGIWLRSICRYMILTRAKTYARRKAKQDDYKTQLSILTLLHVEPAPEPVPDLGEALRYCTQELSETNKQLLAQRYTEQLSTHQISEKNGRTITWVTSTLHRVRSALRTCIEKKERHHD